MLNTKDARTTVSLPEDLLFEIKKKALMERRTIKEIIQEGLRVFLRIDKSKERFNNSAKRVSKVDQLFGSWEKGEDGVDFVKRVRNTKADKKRDVYLKKLWKKSS